MIRQITINIILLLLTSSVSAQGLMFASYDVPANERTSLTVLNEVGTRFSNEVCVEFNIQIHCFEDFGYIFQIRDQTDGTSYGFTLSEQEKDSTQFKFSLLGEQALIKIVLCKKDIEYKWLPVKVVLDLNRKTIAISIDGVTHSVCDVKLPSSIKPKICFGMTDTSLEVPSMSIRKLSVYDNKSRFDFNLSEGDGTKVHDSKGKVVGEVANPMWLIKDSYHWKHRFTYETNNISSVNFDQNTQEFLFIDKDSLVCYNVMSEKRSTSPIRTPIQMQLGTSVINTRDNCLYMYELNNLPLGETTVSSLNLSDKTWKTVSIESLPTQRHHHSSLYDSIENKCIFFGGYGNQRYHDEFCELDIESGHFSTLSFSGDAIAPRFFTAMGARDNDVCYLFGGVGNKTGDKSVGNITYRDLYEVNIRKRTIKQLWNLDHLPAEDRISVRDMYVDTVKNCIYTMQYIPHETYPFVNLYRYSIKDGSSVMLGDSIRISSNDIRSNANLWYSAKLNKFFCTMQEFYLDGTTKVNVYSLNSPPVSMAELSMTPQRSYRSMILYLLTAIVACVILGVTAWRRFGPKRRVDLSQTVPVVKQSMPTSNAVYLFGAFTVYDKVGTDISHLFGYKMRQLFTLLLLNSKNGGSESTVMYDVLWADKDIAKAKNIKGVMLTNLKKILLDIDGIDIIHIDNRYTIRISNLFYCDYLHYQSLTCSTDHSDLLSAAEVVIMQEILDRGPFLKNIDNENFDPYKKDVDEYALSAMARQLRQDCESRNYSNMLKVSKTLFTLDALSESALCGYVYAQSRLNNMESAQKKYTHFVSIYSQSLGEHYQYSLEQLLDSVALDVLLHK